MNKVIIAGYVIAPLTPAPDGQPFEILTIDNSKSAMRHYATIASEFAKKTGFKVESTHLHPGDGGVPRYSFTCSMPETPEFQFNPDEKDADFDGLAKWFSLDSKFLQDLHDKLTDKNDMFLACQFFNDGILAYDVATGDAPIDIPAIRDAYIAGIEKVRADKAKVAEYYNACTTVCLTHSGGKYKEIAFIKDGRLVAFGQFTSDHRGGIYAANNDVQKIPNWNPHDCVAMFRRTNKPLYRTIKKLAYNEPADTFRFDQRTIIKNK